MNILKALIEMFNRNKRVNLIEHLPSIIVETSANIGQMEMVEILLNLIQKRLSEKEFMQFQYSFIKELQEGGK